MAVAKELCESEFIDMFADANRKDEFSYYGKKALYEYYENYSDDINEPFYVNVIDICMNWYECTTKAQTIQEYGYLVDVIELEKEFRDDNNIDSTTDHDDNTYEKFFVEDLDESYKNDLEEVIFDCILEELEQNTTIIRVNETNSIDPTMNVNGVIVQSF